MGDILIFVFENVAKSCYTRQVHSEHVIPVCFLILEVVDWYIRISNRQGRAALSQRLLLRSSVFSEETMAGSMC